MAKKTKTNQKAMNIDCAIDLGTENVVVAGKHPVFNTVTCVPMLDGGYDFPAAVYMESENHCAIGRVAKDNSFLEKDKVATHFKGKLGTSEMIDVNYHSFSPEQLTALVLKEAVISAEQELGKTVRNVILTVPAGFSTHARAALDPCGQYDRSKCSGISGRTNCRGHQLSKIKRSSRQGERKNSDS